MSTANYQRTTKSFKYGNGNVITRTYIRVPKAELAKRIGTDKDDINDGCGSNADGISGFFIPKPNCYDNNYVAGVMGGYKNAFKNDECPLISIPHIEECNIDFLKREVYKYADVMSFIPDRFHRTGDLKGHVIIDDIKFTASIFAKVRPIEWNAWLERQKAANTLRLKKEDKDTVEVEEEFYKKLVKQNKTIHKKGKFGNMAFNHARKMRLKRKRSEIEKIQAMNEIQQDKVWIPADNDVLDEDLPDGKEFVFAKDYKETKTNNIQKNNAFKEITRGVKREPWDCTTHIFDFTQRKYQYDLTKTVLDKLWNKFNVTIPTYEEAITLYGQNTN